MTMTATLSRAPMALIAGAATAAYYAVPDLVRSRTARGWVKVGLLGVTAATSLPDLRATLAANRAQDASDGEAGTGVGSEAGTDASGVAASLDGMGSSAEDTDNSFVSEEAAADAADVADPQGVADLSTRGKVVAGVVAVVLAAAATVSVVVTERWIFRRGEVRAAAGVRLAHTRTALLLGALTAALALVPSPDAPTAQGARDAAPRG